MPFNSMRLKGKKPIIVVKHACCLYFILKLYYWLKYKYGFSNDETGSVMGVSNVY